MASTVTVMVNPSALSISPIEQFRSDVTLPASSSETSCRASGARRNSDWAGTTTFFTSAGDKRGRSLNTEISNRKQVPAHLQVCVALRPRLLGQWRGVADFHFVTESVNSQKMPRIAQPHDRWPRER